MQSVIGEKLNPDHGLFSETKICEDFCAQLKLDSGSKDAVVDDNGVVDTDNDGVEKDAEEEEEFSFVCGGVDSRPITAEDAFVNGQIKPFFPLFNRGLLFSGEDSTDLYENLPIRPPVRKLFVETKEDNNRAPLENDEIAPSNGKAMEASPGVCRKSNSTGFSKIWRFKDLLGRSNSDGRDAFVFLNNEPTVAAKGEEKSGKKESKVKVSGGKGKKGKTASVSAHEAYMRSKSKGEERRRSYLPYRPELMGFFTNVNGGLTKNVHPF